jgi:hypothetical protein
MDSIQIHGSAAKVRHPAGSLSGNVKDVIQDSRGTIIRQVGGDDHYYNGFSLPIPITVKSWYPPSDSGKYPDKPTHLHSITLWLKATKGTWIAWMRLYDGQDEKRYYPYEEHNKYPGNGENLDRAPVIKILEAVGYNTVMPDIVPDHGIMAFIPIGFPKHEVGEVCLIGAEVNTDLGVYEI